MTNRQIYDHELLDQVLTRLEVLSGPPTKQLLAKLVWAYVRTVPWESAFRIARRAQCREISTCARWPEEFWWQHLHSGAGGSCFESNYAFHFILKALAYDCYLTINDMGESVGCHTAIVVLLNDKKWLVDVGFPLYTIIPLSAQGDVYCSSPILRYVVRSQGNNRYQIERRPHPKWYAFTLIDQPASEEQYRQATTADYGPNGHFLDRVIVHKVINGILWRFNADERPYRLEYFENGQRGEHYLDEDVARAVAEKFRMDENVLRLALEQTGH